ncbi:30S ribosome-binding factor RbfA [Blastopirellula marina]|uniref:Ribosome-binding factor A n=1 Tax=Blastopirellula marina TaxID=124 RepID=A0A2S8FAS2_9BACT|nr:MULTISPECIES: 30S ribosome-binding factor RbfA [Pirellulaceae]PQO29232.1 30S ribosome-binding factor RbfA [Blastopirellula marina]RCS50425.1 30S ribosome-binding factor RbfA [Bremerella cremea]
MASRRTLKAASAIREVVSMAILTQLRDPRVKDVTVTKVEVAGDMRNAKVYVSIMGDEKKQQLCLNGLRRSAGFLQSCINDRIDTRYIPKLEFEIDKGVKQALEVSRILKEVLPPSEDEDDSEEVMADEDWEPEDEDSEESS